MKPKHKAVYCVNIGVTCDVNTAVCRAYVCHVGSLVVHPCVVKRTRLFLMHLCVM